MLLVNKSGQYTQDHWQYVGQEDTIPENADVVVDLDRWDEISNKTVRKGIRLSPDTNLTEIESLLPLVDIVLIDFPKFRDGRGFTQGKLLHERFGFKGDIRAGGHVLPDQFSALLSCGFSSALAAEHFPEERWKNAATVSRKNQSPQGATTLLRKLVQHA
ncbi:MAG: DUF934 domain-containing protein [Alcaligenaceae bacterium]|nr:DUF934 domain-containing protein [Alcaligenaceae bacterium]